MSSVNSDPDPSNEGPDTPMRSGFVALVGPTNAGKSTLMNRVVGQKIAITTPKPQTTRNRVLGIHSVDDRGQMIFVDTPGFHRPKQRLGKRMNQLARRTIGETDVVLLVVDVSRDGENAKRVAAGRLFAANRAAVAEVAKSNVPVFVALNKVDRVNPKGRLLPLLQMYQELLPQAELVPISATRGQNVDALVTAVFGALPEGPFLYPPEMISDQAERFLAAEVIREKLIMETKEELPYAVFVEVEQWVDPPDDNHVLHIAAVIHVERDSQKGIVIGKGGQRLKQIGSLARVELEQLFDTKVFLELFVRVEKNWTNDPRRLDRFGYR